MNQSSDLFPDSTQARNLVALQAQMQRPSLKMNLDGGFELGWGVALLLFGVGPYFSVVVTHATWFSAWTAWVTFLPLLCAAFAPFAVPKVIKRCITWPRTGYLANPNEVTFRRLVLLMIFGGALGSSIGKLIVLVQELRGALSPPSGHSASSHFVWEGLEIMVFAALAAYLAPKVISKRRPVPAAYDAAIITHGLRQTSSGRRHLLTVKLTLWVMFLGTPLLLFGLVLGLMFWTKGAARHETTGSELGFAGFLVATNALLYLMSSGVVLKPHRWKWLVLPLMLVGPILAAPAIPYPALKSGLIPLFESMPPVMLCLGTVWFLSGALTLVLLMQRNPRPAAEAP